MGRGSESALAMAVLVGVLMFNSAARAQNAAAPAENAAPTADNAVMLTVLLKHDQSRPLSELNAQLEKQGYYKTFPPPGVEIVSWYIMMGSDRSLRSGFRPQSCATSTARSRTRPGAPIAPSSIRPTTTRRSRSDSATRRSRC